RLARDRLAELERIEAHRGMVLRGEVGSRSDLEWLHRLRGEMEVHRYVPLRGPRQQYGRVRSMDRVQAESDGCIDHPVRRGLAERGCRGQRGWDALLRRWPRRPSGVDRLGRYCPERESLR